MKIEDTRGWEKSSDPYMRKAAYYADIARKLQAHIAEFERQSRERCRHDANRIKELQAQLALKNHPVLLWQENKKLQEQVEALKIDFIGAKSYGNSYFMQLKAALEQKP